MACTSRQATAALARESTNPGDKHAHLAGFGIHVPTAKEFFHNTHVLLCFNSSQGGQHDGGVPCLVLVIHVTHVCKDMSLLREKPVVPMNSRYAVWKSPVKRPQVLQGPEGLGRECERRLHSKQKEEMIFLFHETKSKRSESKLS